MTILRHKKACKPQDKTNHTKDFMRIKITLVVLKITVFAKF